MKKRILALLVCCIFVICIALPFRINAHADALTMQMIVSSAFAISQNAGAAWLFTGMDGSAASSYLEGQINSWLGDSTIVEKFGSEIVRLEAGKLVVPATLYNGISSFLEDFMEMFEYKPENCVIYGNVGGYNWVSGGMRVVDEIRSQPYWIMISSDGTATNIYGAVYVNNVEPANEGFRFNVTDFFWEAYGLASRLDGSTRIMQEIQLGYGYYNLSLKEIQLSQNQYIAPIYIDPSQEWVGQFDNIPDTNLDQLLGDIATDIADNNLVVEGGVIDIPVPTPTPAPLDPDTPLQDVPWGSLDTNLDKLYEQGLEEIGTIGEAKDAITDAIGEQTGVIDQAITNQSGVISGAIDQAVSDIQTAIGEQTGVLDESLTATAEGVESIAEAIEDEAIDWKKFDLRGLFPFCIPFDIYNMLSAFDAEPVAPHVQIPFVIQSIGFSYMLDLDFSAFDPVATIMRQMELICYGIALAWATSKVIKW